LLTRLFVDDSAVPADLYELTAVTLLGRHEFDAAVTVLVVIPVDERRDPLARLLFGSKRLAGLIGPILRGS
jgi:hypothetical protein